MRLQNYDRNQKKRKEYIKQSKARQNMMPAKQNAILLRMKTPLFFQTQMTCWLPLSAIARE